MEQINVRYMYAVIALVILAFIILYTDKINITSNWVGLQYDDEISYNAGYGLVEPLKGRKKHTSGGGGKAHKKKKGKSKNKCKPCSMCVIL